MKAIENFSAKFKKKRNTFFRVGKYIVVWLFACMIFTNILGEAYIEISYVFFVCTAFLAIFLTDISAYFDKGMLQGGVEVLQRENKLKDDEIENKSRANAKLQADYLNLVSKEARAQNEIISLNNDLKVAKKSLLQALEELNLLKEDIKTFNERIAFLKTLPKENRDLIEKADGLRLEIVALQKTNDEYKELITTTQAKLDKTKIKARRSSSNAKRLRNKEKKRQSRAERLKLKK